MNTCALLEAILTITISPEAEKTSQLFTWRWNATNYKYLQTFVCQQASQIPPFTAALKTPVSHMCILECC